MSYKLIEHTADLFVEVTGSSLENVFEEAAKAMFDLIGETNANNEEFSVELDANDKEELLVRWLTELLAEHDATNRLFTDFKVKIQGTHLVGQAKGGPGQVKDNIKGVTFHNLKIRQDANNWKCRVLFDV